VAVSSIGESHSKRSNLTQEASHHSFIPFITKHQSLTTVTEQLMDIREFTARLAAALAWEQRGQWEQPCWHQNAKPSSHANSDSISSTRV